MASLADLGALEAALRQAVLADSFAETHVLIDQYTAALAANLSQVQSRAEILLEQDRAQRLFDWIEIMVSSVRSSAAAEYDRLTQVSRYGPTPEYDTSGSQA